MRLARSRRARIADILYELSRDRLKQLCRAFDLDDTGRAKAELIDTPDGKRRHSPTDSLPR